MTFTPKFWSRLAILALIAAGVSAQLAWLHMVSVWALGEICGRGPALHCPWCAAAVGFAALAAMSARCGARRRIEARVRAD
ncbi:hypothetical protein ASD21_09040 [Caulobacter sp. Root1455]|uniref:hypothetical protein n=1 Tax=unclassified Caulobacter TaxID=2648921 RepID=UPI0006F638A8|nr:MULTISPECIES: hypothetical protein [unclassified Caulobacter]KQY31175.1 hypothetical protein ASD38_07500 [Caulobacter sp. Root487D2Y]KQY95472.1 hypothetical protein ASD21_09040 [Caulobacter sp. Root1455]